MCVWGGGGGGGGREREERSTYFVEVSSVLPLPSYDQPRLDRGHSTYPLASYKRTAINVRGS